MPTMETDDARITDLSAAHFKLVFESATALRTLADVLSSMLETVELHVVNTPEFKGVKIEAMDAKQISLVIAKVRAPVEMDCERTTFCVNTKVFNTCVKSAPAHYSVTIESVPQSSSIRITAFDELTTTSVTRFTVPTLVCDAPQVQFEDLDYENDDVMHVDMETSCLKGIVRMCLAFQGETLTFRVQRPKGAASPKRQCPGKKAPIMLTISSNGACEQEHTFYSSRDGTGPPVCMSLAPAAEEVDVVYEEVFGARHLS